MADEWIGIIMEKAPVYVKGAMDLTVRDRMELSMLQSRGNIKLNHDGSYEEFYDVDYKEPTITGFGDGARATFSRNNYLKQAKKNSRGHIATDEMHIKEKALLGHKSSNLVNRYNRIIPKLIDGIKKQLGYEMYADGAAAGNEFVFEGFETFCSSFTALGSAADKIVKPTDSYNNLSCALAQGGSWNTDFGSGNYPNASLATDWPEGKGDPQYDFWSPKLVHFPSTSWGTGGTSWLANSERVLRTTGSWLRMTAGVDRANLVSLMASHLLDDFKNAMASRGESMLPHPEARDLGFPEVLNFDGIALQSSFGIPANRCYVFDIQKVTMEFIENAMVKINGPDWDPNSQSYKFSARSFGNYLWVPKSVAKIADFS